MKNGEQETTSELRTFYARTDLRDAAMWSGDSEVAVTFMNRRGVFEVDLPSYSIPSHDQVVAITFDPRSLVVESITSPNTNRIFLDRSFDEISPEIVVRGYWKNPNR